MFRNLRIGTRLMAAFGILLLASLATAVAGWNSIVTIKYGYSDRLGNEVAMRRAVKDVTIDVLSARRFEKDVLINAASPDIVGSYITKWEESISNTKTQLATATKLTTQDATRKMLQDVATNLSAYENGARGV